MHRDLFNEGRRESTEARHGGLAVTCDHGATRVTLVPRSNVEDGNEAARL